LIAVVRLGAGVFVEKNFLGKQITAVEGALTWMIGGDIETSR